MSHTSQFAQQLAASRPLLGTCISYVDPTVTESLTGVLDFVWIDAEHGALSVERVQGHIMATKGTGTIPLVRVAANDPALIKPMLDAGAAGIIVPLVKTADDVRRAVAACLYPPAGTRGIGPRRPSGYGAHGGAEFYRQVNAAMVTIVQIEQAEAVENLDAILRVPGLTSIVVGPADLAASLGHTGEPRHPEVTKAIDGVLAKAAAANVPVGIAVGDDVQELASWAAKGMAWLAMGADFIILRQAALRLTREVRQLVAAK